MLYAIVEKKNPLAIHGIFYTHAKARRHLEEVIPALAERRAWVDKTLTKDCFEIKEYRK